MTADHFHRRATSRALGAPDAGGQAHGPRDRDNRRGVGVPSTLQRALAAEEGADVRWNRLGTPASVSSETGVLAEGLRGNPVAVARAWTSENRELFGLSEQSVATSN